MKVVQRLAHILAQHQVLDIGCRNDDTLVSRQATHIANIKDALDLFVNTPDRLNLALLVHGPGDRQ